MRLLLALVACAALALATPRPSWRGLPVRRAPAGSYDGGFVVTAQFKCLDLLCPHWELDISALNHITAIPEVLITLVPKSPAET